VRKVKYFTKELLIAANDEAVRTKRNRSLYEDKVAELPDLKFPIGMSMLHNDHEMRVCITIAKSANGPFGTVWLDIQFETYNALPEAEVPE